MKIIGSLLFTIFLLKLEAQSAFVQDYLAKWDNGVAYTLEFAQAMPADKYNYTPTPQEMEFHEQLKHVAGNLVWLCSTYLNGDPDHVDPSKVGNTKAEIIPMLEKAFAYARNTIKKQNDRTLNEEVNFIAGPLTKRRLLFLLSDHITHHRGQLVVYLRLNSIEPPKYKGW